MEWRKMSLARIPIHSAYLVPRTLLRQERPSENTFIIALGDLNPSSCEVKDSLSLFPVNARGRVNSDFLDPSHISRGIAFVEDDRKDKMMNNVMCEKFRKGRRRRTNISPLPEFNRP
jgi:hypothetical protein